MNLSPEEMRAMMQSHADSVLNGPPPPSSEGDRNCLAYWYPKLVAAKIPVPRTEIIRWPGKTWELANRGENIEVPGFNEFCEQIKAAALKIGQGPWFLRTGQGSGKHQWKRCCYLQDLAKIPDHVDALVEWSHMVDMMGCYHDVFVVREMLPVKPICTLPAYGDFPLVTEVRGFVRDGEVVCVHPYWPAECVRDGFPYAKVKSADLDDSRKIVDFLNSREERPRDLPANIDELIAQTIPSQHDLTVYVKPLLQKVAVAFMGDGAWSVDVLKTTRGWFVTDMAEAHRSFHWEGCPEAK